MSITPPIPPQDPTLAQPAEEVPVPQPGAMPHIGEEHGTGKENLPPTKLVGIILGILIVTVGILAFVFRAKSPSLGTIDDVQVVDVEGQNAVMLAINVTIQNNGKDAYKMRSISAGLETGSASSEDHPASPIDFNRYLEIFPSLKTNMLPRLELQTIEPGGKRTGRIIVSFPVNAAEFAQRKSLKVTVTAYGESVPLVMVK